LAKKPVDFWKGSTIIRDSREKLPYVFTGEPVVVSGLRTGDYSVSGMEHLVCVERKSQGDYWGCLGKSRKRFVAELERMKEIPWSLVVIEAGLSMIREGFFFYNGSKAVRSKIPGSTALNSAIFWELAYPSIRFHFCGSREDAEWMTLNWLKMALRYHRHIEKETSIGPPQEK
jgi:ERCC4-type nuclease